MKEFFAVALLSALFAAPVLADEKAAKPSVGKPVPATQPMIKHDHKMVPKEDECDNEHAMGCAHYEHGMMEGPGADMMMEPDMHLLKGLALGKEQQAKINQLADELKHNNWATQGLINDESAKLRDLYEADKRDPAAIGKEYQKVFDLKRQMIETYLDTQNRIEEVFTPEQRAKIKEARQQMSHMYKHHMQ